ncbi:sensor histidine kinase [Foetidibacter luteolus]|uniref:sensor histidine kinase n=1 Tax=Foetidibacter luteolus TaxID=2608880 RepID=UPI00129AE293|nr:ATP-binding protein [Foetidibacter luteolus]
MSQESKIIIAIVATTIFLLMAVFFVIVLAAYINKRKKGLLAEQKAMQSAYENELLKTQLEVQEQTFQQISQEIHDNIGQSLSFIKLTINTINLNNYPDAETKLNESKFQLTRTIQDLRNLSKSLNTDFINRSGLVNSILQQIELLKKTGLYQAEVNMQGEEKKYSLQAELIIFRIVQETLNNFVKHAAAANLKIDILYEEKRLHIIIEDDGVGFDSDLVNSSHLSGLGLNNMANRMRLINGSYSIKSAPGRGSKTEIILPNPPAA